MSYAILQLQGKQYQVREGDILEVARLEHAEGTEFESADVLLLRTEKETLVGAPLVPKVRVKLKVLNHESGPKLRVATYKAKSRYRRVKGHRSALTRIEVRQISGV